MKRFFTFLLAAVAFVACSQHEFEENASIQQNVKQLTVAFDEQTRIKLDKDVKSVWVKGDELSVLFGDKNEKWSYEGESGERTAKLTAPGNSTLEDGEAAMAYPYNAAYSYDAAAKSIDVELPAVQGYAIDSYGMNGNLMTAYSTTSNFTLRSVVGWLRVELEGNGEKVQSIEVKGNNGEQVAGKISVDVATAVATLATKAEDKGDKVTLSCGSDVELGAKAKVFYVALPPQNYSKGITATVTFAEGEPYEIVKNAAIEIKRNHIVPMASFKYDGVVPEVYELAYTTNDGKPLDPYTTEGFGGEFMENIYDAATGRGVLKFAGAITTIPEQAFAICENLTWIDIPEGITTIGASAFTGCTALEEITIPASVTDVGNEAFKNCPCKATINCDNVSFSGAGFTEVVIGDGVTAIGEYAFYTCSSLTSVTIPDSVTTIGDYAFLGCDSLTSVTIGDSVTTVGNHAFGGCRSLTSVTIPDSVTTIGDWAFYNCDSLTNVTIPDSVTTIGNNAFYDCNSLTSVVIPDSVTTIGENAFNGCRSLTSVYCEATTPPTLGDGYVFDYNADGRKIYVPKDSLREYKMAENWSEYADYIVGYDFESEPTEPEKTLEDGTYALVVKSGESYFAMACDHVLSGSDKRFGALDITSTFNATSMTVEDNAIVWSVAKRAEGGYFVTFNGKYLYGSESENVAKVGSTESYITINANGDDTYQLITSAATTEKNLALNTSASLTTPAFAFYKSDVTSKYADDYATAFYLVPVQFKGIAVEKSSVELTAEAAEGTIAVTVSNISETPTATSDADWLTVTLEGDELKYSATANTTSASREAVVTIAAGSIEKEITFTQASPVTEKRVTVKEFLEAAETETDYYILSGTITSVNNTTYGNFNLMDDTGTVYIYGLCSPEGENKYWEASGAKVGDDITVKTLRSSFNGSPQGEDAIFVELLPGTRAFWLFDKTSVTILADGGSQSVKVTGGNWKSEVSVASDNAQFTASYADGVVTITAKANTTKDMIEGVVTVTCGTLKQEISVKQPSNSAEVKEFVITFPGNPSAYTNNYTSSFTITLQDSYSFAFAGINNGNEANAWTAVRMGRKGNPSVATIATEFAVPYAVKSVDVNFTQVKADFEFNEAKLVVATDSKFSNVVEEVEVVPTASGKVSYVVTTPATKYYYKLVYDMPATGDSNGVFRIDSVTFVK